MTTANVFKFKQWQNTRNIIIFFSGGVCTISVWFVLCLFIRFWDKRRNVIKYLTQKKINKRKNTKNLPAFGLYFSIYAIWIENRTNEGTIVFNFPRGFRVYTRAKALDFNEIYFYDVWCDIGSHVVIFYIESDVKGKELKFTGAGCWCCCWCCTSVTRQIRVPYFLHVS